MIPGADAHACLVVSASGRLSPVIIPRGPWGSKRCLPESKIATLTTVGELTSLRVTGLLPAPHLDRSLWDRSVENPYSCGTA